MERKLKRLESLVIGVCFFAGLAMAFYCIHDMQMAEGVGLFFALKAGKDRLLFDLAVDVAGGLGLSLLIAVPCLVLGYWDFPALLRFLLVYLSLMPTLSMAYLLDPLGGEEGLRLQPLFVLLQTVIPFLCLWVAILGREAWKKWYGVCAGCAALLCLAGFFVQPLQPLFQFIMTYLLLLMGFDLWERVWKKYPALNTWGWILFGGLGFRAFYVLSQVMAEY